VRCAGPAPRRRAAARPAARRLAGASGRRRPGKPAARRSPPRSSAAGRPAFRGRRPGLRGAGRERLSFPGAARPWVRDDGRSARPAASSPAPAGPTAGGCPGRPALARGERGKAPRSQWAAGLAGGPALPEGKAGRGGRGAVPGGDLVRALAVAGSGGGRPWCRPAGRAGLPPGTAGIHPRLRPPRQVGPARRGGGLDARPRATGRCWPAPGRPGGADPVRGPAAGRVPRGGHGGAHRDGARPRRTRARRASRYRLARPRAARYSVRRICHRPLPWASRFSVPLQKSGFWGLFSPAPLKLVLVRQKSALVAGVPFTSGGPSCTSRGPAVYPAGNDAGQRPDIPGREQPAAGAAGRG